MLAKIFSFVSHSIIIFTYLLPSDFSVMFVRKWEMISINFYWHEGEKKKSFMIRNKAGWFFGFPSLYSERINYYKMHLQELLILCHFRS